jgi:hypothetical protein
MSQRRSSQNILYFRKRTVILSTLTSRVRLYPPKIAKTL